MIHDAKVLTLANPPTWREKLGVPSAEEFLALISRVASLETLVDQQAAQLRTLAAGANLSRMVFCPADGLTYQLRLADTPGGPTLDWAPYPVQLVTVDAGAGATMGDVPAACPLGVFDTITGADGALYDLSVVEVEGVKLVNWELKG